MIKTKLLFYVLLLTTLNYACVTTPTISYFDSADSTKLQTLPSNIPDISIIRPHDILAITVSSLNKESNDILNFNNLNPLTTTSFPGQNMGQRGQPLGFLVNTEGEVDVPMVGKIKLDGQTLAQSANTIRIEVEKLLKNPAVNVRFLNHKFSVLGEVGKPGVYNLLDDKTTLPEALALAGDLSPFGNRKNIMVVRDYYGKREMVRINLLNKELFESPYYYLKDGDMIYIEPVKAKATYTEQKIQLAPLYLSGFSALAVLLNVVFNALK
jgi:polysaccharide biosynthesis/export protein